MYVFFKRRFDNVYNIRMVFHRSNNAEFKALVCKMQYVIQKLLQFSNVIITSNLLFNLK